MAWRSELEPQQVTEPSLFIPQVCHDPALIKANSSSGGEAWPHLSLPQQATKPSFLTPQV